MKNIKTSIVLILGVVAIVAILPNIAYAQDSLPWKGVIVFEDWVRVDDAPGTSPHNANHPQMIMDNNLNMYAVWQDDRDNNDLFDIYFSRSADTGKTWSPNINLSTGLPAGLDNRYPWIAADDSSRLYVVWQREAAGGEWKVFFSRSFDGGATFSAADTIQGITISNSTTSNINSGPQPKIIADMTVDTTCLYLAWVDDGTSVLRIDFARSVDLGATFGNQLIVDNNAGNINREPFLAVDDSGYIHCAWRWGTGGSNQDPHPWIGYNRSTDYGATFQPQDVIVLDDTLTNVYRGNPTVTVNPKTGNVLVAWEDSRVQGGNNGPDLFFSRSIDGGITFDSTSMRCNIFSPDLAVENRKPAISIDPSGIAVVAWHDNYGTGHFGIHLTAFNDNDSVSGTFSAAMSLFDTYTEDAGGAFGANLYPPSLYVTEIDSVTNFFLVWQDFYEDTARGNIYSVRGRVVPVLADLDVDNDSLDVHGDTMDLRIQPAGPAYSPFAKGTFILTNTGDAYNPDSFDGPSITRVDSIVASSSLDSVFVLGLPASMTVGQVNVCTLAVVIPVGTAPGSFLGTVLISGVDSVGAPVEETFVVRYQGPEVRGSLDSLEVVPIPYRPGRDPTHDAIHFQGLVSGARVRVYDLAGALVWNSDSGTDDASDGHISWGADIASGIYIYLVTAPDGDHRKGKLSVIR